MNEWRNGKVFIFEQISFGETHWKNFWVQSLTRFLRYNVSDLKLIFFFLSAKASYSIPVILKGCGSLVVIGCNSTTGACLCCLWSGFNRQPTEGETL